MVGLGFYLFKLATVTEFEQKVEVAAYELKSSQLDNYVSLCLRQVMDDGLRKIGTHGGFINEPPNAFGLEDGAKISVAMPRFSELGTPDYPVPPDYPKPHFSIFSDEVYPFSGKALPFLCQKGGPNDVAIAEYARPCPYGSYGENSIQEQLGLYASIQLKECVSKSLLQDISGFQLETKDPQVIITLGEENMLAKATFPITFKAEGKETTKSFDFSTEIPVRLRKVFGMAEYLISNDRYYLNFDMDESYATQQWRTEFYDENMVINRRCPNCAAPFTIPCTALATCTDVINITDKLSSIEGESFSFLFARSPRYPVLDWIHQSTATQYGVGWDYVVIQGSTITIEAKGNDPDEDALRFHFSGWKSEQSEKWDTTLPGCEDMELDDGQDTFACMRPRDFWADEERMEVHDATATIRTRIQYHDEHGNPKDHLDADLGVHTVHVEVEDEHGMKDWQDVKILVISEPEAEAAIGCLFPDAPALCRNADGTPIVSLEDPIVLDASASAGLAGGAGFTWSFRKPDGTSVADPIATNEIKTIAPLRPNPLNVYKTIFKDLGAHLIGLALRDMPGVTDTVPVEVKQCYPYRIMDIASVPPYPYNRSDPFLAAHACCNSDSTLAGTEKKCFKEETYGSYRTFDDTIYRNPAAGLMINYPVTWIAKDGESESKPLGTPPALVAAAGIDNDIFKRTFERSCGTVTPPYTARRGNVCEGPAAETRDVIRECNDYKRPGQDERCEGPPSVIPAVGAILCEKYTPGETFESRNHLDDRFGRPANGACIDILELSSGNGGVYNSSGPFSCAAQCDGAGECRSAANCACQNADNPDGGDSQCNGLKASLFAPGSDGAGTTAGGVRIFCSGQCRTVEADSSAPACQWTVRGALPALPNLFSPGRLPDKRCCGDDASEILTTTSGRTACCSAANSCVTPDGACLGPDQISADGQYYCRENTLKACASANECDYAGTYYCNGADWTPFAPPRTTTDNLLCGTGADGEISYCGQCQAKSCTAHAEFCPPETPVCNRVGNEFRCRAV